MWYYFVILSFLLRYVEEAALNLQLNIFYVGLALVFYRHNMGGAVLDGDAK